MISTYMCVYNNRVAACTKVTIKDHEGRKQVTLQGFNAIINEATFN